MEQFPQTITTTPVNIQKKKRAEIPCRADANCKNPSCPYKHTVPRTVPNTSLTPCVFFMQWYCREGTKCKFYHPAQGAPVVGTVPPPVPPIQNQPPTETDEARLREMAIKNVGLR